MNEPEYLSPKEVQAVFGIRVSTLASWRCRGLGPDYYKPEGTVYYKRSELDEYMKAQRVKCYVPRFARGR